jgi:hypothetical protein
MLSALIKDLVMTVNCCGFDGIGKLRLTYKIWPLHGHHSQGRAPLAMKDDIPHRR